MKKMIIFQIPCLVRIAAIAAILSGRWAFGLALWIPEVFKSDPVIHSHESVSDADQAAHVPSVSYRM